MLPQKENFDFIPELLVPPPVPENDCHLGGVLVGRRNRHDISEQTPFPIKNAIRQKYQHLLHQHDAIEIAYWGLESFRLCPDWQAYDLDKYVAFTNELYAAGKLKPDVEMNMSMKHACACIKDRLPGVPTSHVNLLADKMIMNWLEGRFFVDKDELRLIQNKIWNLKKYVSHHGNKCELAVGPVMQEWVRRLYRYTLPNGKLPDEPWDDVESSFSI